jgi:hypothetical protein
MAKKKSLQSAMSDWDGAVIDEYDPYLYTVETQSPSLNFTFGKTWGLPQGYSIALWGPEKGGKSLITNMFISQLHQSDPDACVIKYNTEHRERLQFPASVRAKWGVDNDRYMAIESNAPSAIFDKFEKEIPVLIQDGYPIKLVIIDSLQGIQGRRDANAKSIDVQQIGDHAKTVGDGLKRILPVQRKYNIALAVVCQARDEMDIHEQMRGNKVKMGAPRAVRHHCEYFMYVEKNVNKDGRTDIEGNEYRNNELKDLDDNKDLTGHRIRVCMKDSSAGPKGRVGEFTLDYEHGIVGIEEEVFKLARARGVLERVGHVKYVFGNKEWNGGVPGMLKALREDPELRVAMIKELKRRDLAGMYAGIDKELADQNGEIIAGT